MGADNIQKKPCPVWGPGPPKLSRKKPPAHIKARPPSFPWRPRAPWKPRPFFLSFLPGAAQAQLSRRTIRKSFWFSPCPDRGCLTGPEKKSLPERWLQLGDVCREGKKIKRRWGATSAFNQRQSRFFSGPFPRNRWGLAPPGESPPPQSPGGFFPKAREPGPPASTTGPCHKAWPAFHLPLTPGFLENFWALLFQTPDPPWPQSQGQRGKLRSIPRKTSKKKLNVLFSQNFLNGFGPLGWEPLSPWPPLRPVGFQ